MRLGSEPGALEYGLALYKHAANGLKRRLLLIVSGSMQIVHAGAIQMSQQQVASAAIFRHRFSSDLHYFTER
jgi:hypothetical protein